MTEEDRIALALWQGGARRGAGRASPAARRRRRGVRRRVRDLAREAGVRIRTSLMDDVVVAVPADVAISTDDQATMRAKLTPPG